ncbi:DUF4013 domain-containing protein [Methanoregula sp.]|uniref:DUF4013 domain-containing protein n=1 Tax=Methanoregula sp. TaxID=2052170 RepID=UPI00236F220D|nr:DUF4013 domain-containing protein [Methanoregula sp.]MDD1687440.1 DUF4013 domain-containing protein [Methanoregula sp.]
MDLSHFIRESAAFTRETLTGRWSRWLILVLLALPWLALSSLAGSLNLIESNRIHWALMPWGEAGLLIALGLLCYFLISGYVVRLLKGDSAPPEFDNRIQLILDGIKVNAIPLVWIIVPSILAFIGYSVADGGILPGLLKGTTLGWVVILILLGIQLVILFIAAQYVIVGAIRFARTGYVREAFNVLAIKRTMDHIGIVNYFIALGIVTLTGLLYMYGLRAVSFVPYAGGYIAHVLWPPVMVFTVRFMAHFCDEDMTPGGKKTVMDLGARALSRITALGMIPEILAWLAIVAVLSLISFTPMVLVVGSISGLFA